MTATMRNLLSSEYFPFGSQYYRAPSPHPTEWERDLRNMAKLGFNTVKFWVQWRWNHPEEDTFYFEDIDRLMDLAGENGLRVMLNTIFDVAPAWIYEKYPDASMLTLDGRRIGPQSQPHRQIGGLGLCFNHADAIEHMFRFLRTAVERYRDHPALEIWNVGSEPELTSSMSEMRLYANDLRRMGDMLCYCEHCRREFRTWLQKKYGSLAELNRRWNRNYASFDQVEIPKTRNTFNDMIDWRMFFVNALGENVKRRFEVAREIDQGKHPLMCHHVFVQGFPLVSTANDPWNVGQYGDLHGFTQMDDAMMSDVLRSCAKGKPVISAEMLMLPGYTLDLHKTIDANDIKRFIFTGVAANQKGFVFWQYRPEILGREAPTWGLTYLDGQETPWLKSFAEVGRVLQKNASFLHDARPERAEVAILYSPENQIFAWTATGRESMATNSLLGTHKALYQRNFRIDFLHPREFETADLLDNYKVLLVPFPYCLNQTMCQSLTRWVKNGGVLIGEAYFAGWYSEEGCHHTTVPGYGLHEIFKVRQAVVDPADENDEVSIEVDRDLPYVPKGTVVIGSLVKETFFVDGAEVLAQHESGEPAITLAKYGAGKAILIGSYVALPFFEKGIAENGDLLASLVEMSAKIERPRVNDNLKIRVDTLRDERGRTMVILQNLEDRAISSKVHFPKVLQPPLVEQFSGERLSTSKDSTGTLASVQLSEKEVKVYCAE